MLSRRQLTIGSFAMLVHAEIASCDGECLGNVRSQLLSAIAGLGRKARRTWFVGFKC
jgi:hypothetical protein